MKLRKRRREVETLSLSFLDAISCGFGAIILLLVITKLFEPIRLEESNDELDRLIARYEEELQEILGETDRVQRERRSTRENVVLDRQQIAQLERELTRIRGAYDERQDDTSITADLAGQLAQAKQSLTEEMERLLADRRPDPEDYKVGGIPVDSEYIVFIIDTSGSMYRYEWDRVQQQIQETLDIYPTVKGLQILNDEGEHMFRSYRGEWIPDTPSRRQAIIDALPNWHPFSNSSPREGILAAIDTYYDPEKKISLYIYSDDFAYGSINGVVREIDRRNKADEEGNRLVRIHGVAFPMYWDATGSMLTGGALAILMRAICQRNGGTFVALPSRRAD
jgi:hypothetical protein